MHEHDDAAQELSSEALTTGMHHSSKPSSRDMHVAGDEPSSTTSVPNNFVDFQQFLNGIVAMAMGVVAAAVWICAIVAVVNPRVLPSPPSLLIRASIMCVAITPALVSSSFMVTTVMMWYGRLFLRFALGCLLLAPPTIVFYLGMSMIQGPPTNEGMLRDISLTMYCLVLAAAAVAVVAQLSSSIVLIHSERVCEVSHTGIGMIGELTALASIACLAFTSIPNLRGYALAVLLFAGAGGLIASLVIAQQVVYLSSQQVSVWWKYVSAMLVLIVSTFIVGFLSTLVLDDFFGLTTQNWPWLTGLTFFISAQIIAVSRILLVCLDYCGWRCVDRRSLASVSRTPTADNPFN